MADLDLDRIAAAALAVADERGVSAFTMRAVSDALGVTPMALYHHVADKKALVAVLVDAVLQEIPLPPPTGDWREDLWTMACWFREIAVAHPAVSHLRRAHRVWTPSMPPITEHWYNLWLQSGLDLDDAVRAGSTTSMAIIGLVEEELVFAEMDRPASDALTWTPTAKVAWNTISDPDANFELIVRTLLDGVHARLSAGELPLVAEAAPTKRLSGARRAR